MTVEIKAVPPSDARRWFEAVNLAFAEHIEEKQWTLDSQIIPGDRILGAYDGDRVVGGGAAFTFQMTVPGGRQVDAAGVTMVGVLPTHRRQGILRQLMTRQLADVRARGEAIAALWASEGSIYQRFGYGLATLNGTVDIERDRAALRKSVEPRGTVELLTADEARPHLEAVYDLVRARTPGFYVRSDKWWDVWIADPEFRRRDMSRKFHAVHFRDGRAVAYCVYRIKNDWQPSGPANTLMITEIAAIDADATAEMWRYAFGVDLMTRIRSRLGPAEHPLLLMVTEPRRLSVRLSDGVWVRIVDVKAALEGRGYAADGSLVIDVADDFMPEVAGRWRVTASGGAASVEETTDAPDLRLDVTDLGAVYLGGITFARLASAGRTEELSVGARATAERMFVSDVPPWCPEVF
ncbi:MAG: GNAT family N-acetyltransferase [Candidatus Limnocylindrales bacterium]